MGHLEVCLRTAAPHLSGEEDEGEARETWGLLGEEGLLGQEAPLSQQEAGPSSTAPGTQHSSPALGWAGSLLVQLGTFYYTKCDH